MNIKVNSLPDEVLISIFELLDFKTLKEATLVCRKWNNVISSSSATMRKFELQLMYDGSDQESLTSGRSPIRRLFSFANHFRFFGFQTTSHSEKVKQIMNSKRQHVAVVFSCSTPITLSLSEDADDKFLKIVKRLGPRMQYLTFLLHRYSFTTDCSSMQRIFREMPTLKELDMGQVVIKAEKDICEPVLMRHLTSLVYNQPNWRILSLISAPNIRFLNNSFLKSSDSSLKEFLQAATSLEVLYTNTKCFSSEIFKAGGIKLPFKLKTLWLGDKVGQRESILSQDITIRSNLFAFLRSQGAFLAELIIADASIEFEEFYEIVFTQMPALKKLKASLQNAPSDKWFYKNLKGTSSIQELCVFQHFSSEAAAIGVLSLCPQLQQLSAKGDHHLPDLLEFISKTNLKLEFLFLRFIGYAGIPKFNPAFKKLSLIYVDNLKLEEFVKSNPNVELKICKTV